MSLKALEMEQLVPGRSLSWDIVDDGGRILLPKGTPVIDDMQAKSLFVRGWILEPDAPVPGAAGVVAEPPGKLWRRRPVDMVSNRPRFFHALERFIQPLEEVIADILNGKGRNVSDHILQLCAQIQLQTARDADALLAAIELFDGGRYGTIHALHVATVCELVIQQQNQDPVLRRPLIAAALLRDIGFLELQDELDQQSEPLTRQQQDEVRAHPLASVRLLKEAGVNNVDWLTAVGQHHERLNGSGYPHGLAGDQITPWARIIAIADTYSALTKTRAYRPAMQGPNAMMTLFKSRGSLVDEGLTQEVIRTLGLWTPGVLVKLANGETAVVIRRTANLKAPEVRSIADPEGKLYPIYQIRDASEPETLIQDVLPRSSPLRDRLNYRQLWGEITLLARR
jgi:HD-GYP domain-containing protein (c-di-GMP phosphodiesterase class II)